MTVRLSGVIVATAVLALAVPAVSTANVSSLDAYAGAAAVLGKPHHKHHRHSGASAMQRGGHGAAAIASKPRGSAVGSSRAAGLASGGGAAQSGASGSTGTTGGAGTPARGGASAGGSASASGGASANGSSSASGGESGLARGVRNAIPASSSSSSLTGLDIAVLCAAALMLLGTGLLMRRLGRQPR